MVYSAYLDALCLGIMAFLVFRWFRESRPEDRKIVRVLVVSPKIELSSEPAPMRRTHETDSIGYAFALWLLRLGCKVI